MSSKIEINVKDAKIVVPDTSAPDTGLFSVSQKSDIASVGNMVVPVAAGVVLVLLLVVAVFKMFKNRKQKRSGKFTINSSGHVALRLMGIAVLVLLSGITVLQYNKKKDAVNAVELMNDNKLSITAEDIKMDVELEDEPVFKVSKSLVKVDVATQSGYILMAYIDSDTADLTNETSTKSSSRIRGLDSSYAQKLGENTWGVSLAAPESFDAPVFRGLPVGEKNAMTLKVTGATATSANDVTALYYATYLTPELDEGKYTGATINYIAVANPTTDDITVRYNLHDLDLGTTSLFNTVTYGIDCALAYVGSNCQRAYAGEPVLQEDSFGLTQTFEPGSYYGIYPVSVPGADLLRIKVEVDESFLSDDDELRQMFGVLAGAYSSLEEAEEAIGNVVHGGNIMDLVLYDMESYFPPDFLTDSTTFYTANTDITVLLQSTQEVVNWIKLTITPVYFELPIDIQTTETSVCRIYESDNLNSDWNDEDDDASRVVYLDNRAVRSITLPGADGVRVDIDYNLPAGSMGVVMIEGKWDGDFENTPDSYRYIGSMDGESVSGTDVFDFDGDTVTFYVFNTMNEMVVLDPNLGFNAKISPIYNDDTEGTESVQTCRIVNKDGEYQEPDSLLNDWYYPFDDSFDRVYYFRNEKELMSIMYNVYDEFRGHTIDVYTDIYK